MKKQIITSTTIGVILSMSVLKSAYADDMMLIPVSYSLQSYGTSSGGTVFAIDNNIFWSASGGAGGGRGFNVAVINIDDSSHPIVEAVRNFDTWGDRLTGGAHYAFVTFLNNVPTNRLVMVATGDEAGLTSWGGDGCTKLPYPWVDAVVTALLNIGSTNINNYCYGDSWGMIFIKGQTTPMREGLARQANPYYSYYLTYVVLNKSVPTLKLDIIAYQELGGNNIHYTTFTTNAVIGRDVEFQYADDLPNWIHILTYNSPTTNVLEVSGNPPTEFYPKRFFRARIDNSTILLPHSGVAWP